MKHEELIFWCLCVITGMAGVASIIGWLCR